MSCGEFYEVSKFSRLISSNQMNMMKLTSRSECSSPGERKET